MNNEKGMVSMDFEKEVWKDIEGYDGRYQISNYGRVWNTVTQSYMKPQLKKTGYYNINLMRANKKIVTERIHRLVALYFCHKAEGCNVVNHLDSNKTNNYYKNLEWTTISGNTKHCYENNEQFRRQLHEISKIGAEKKVLILKVEDTNGKCIGIFRGIQSAAVALGINEKTVRNIKDGKFKSNRYGYLITAVEKGGDAV